jgi:16S rRNA (adenine1518-N6/adenine1519-N6)-dimethyltransferase
MRAKKRFGQNFLTNPEIAKSMVEVALMHQPSHLLEIGPGQGALTSLFLKAKTSTTAIEIDRDLATYLREKFAHIPWNLIEQDVLEVDLNKLNHTKKIDVIIGNLPYNISTPFLIKYRDELPNTRGVFLVQKEVALRLQAPPGSKDYGRLSVMLQQAFDIKILFHVSADNFHPRPAVQSSFIECTPHQRHYSLPKLFEPIIKESFCHRRKMLKKSLSQFMIDFNLAGIDGSRRPETLSIDEFILLANHSQDPDKTAE